MGSVQASLDVAERAQRFHLLRGKKRLAAAGEVQGQRLVRLPLRFQELGILLHQVGPLLVEAVQAVGVIPEVVQQQRNGAVAVGRDFFLVRVRVDLQRRAPAPS